MATAASGPAQKGRVCVPVDGNGVPLNDGLINKNVQDMSRFRPGPGTLAYATPCGSGGDRCLNGDRKATSCGGAMQCGIPGLSMCSSSDRYRDICVTSPQVTYNRNGAGPIIKECCTKETIGSTPVASAGCGYGYCPGSDLCMDAAETMCTTCTGTDTDNPCPSGKKGTVIGARGDELCDSMKTYDFVRWKNMMEQICLDANGAPNDNTRMQGCIRFLNDPDVQKIGTKLETFCRSLPVQPVDPDDQGNGTPAYDEFCGCYRSPAFYDRFMSALAAQWVIPEGLIDGRPVCLYPGCRNALITDKSQVSDKPCKDANIALCMQKVTVNNAGQISGNIHIDQSCPAGSGIMPRGGKTVCANDNDCPGGMRCDTRTTSCANPNDVSTECTTDQDCQSTGRLCGPVDPSSKKRFCTTAAPQGTDGGGAQPAGLPVWAWVLIAIGAVLVLLAAAWLVLRWFRSTPTKAG